MLIRRRTFDAAKDTAYALGHNDGYEHGVDDGECDPVKVHVAGGTEEIRQRLMRGVTAPNGDVGRAHRIAGVGHLAGFRGGVLLCGYETPPDVEREALRLGMTLIAGDGGR